MAASATEPQDPNPMTGVPFSSQFSSQQTAQWIAGNWNPEDSDLVSRVATSIDGNASGKELLALSEEKLTQLLGVPPLKAPYLYKLIHGDSEQDLRRDWDEEKDELVLTTYLESVYMPATLLLETQLQSLNTFCEETGVPAREYYYEYSSIPGGVALTDENIEDEVVLDDMTSCLDKGQPIVIWCRYPEALYFDFIMSLTNEMRSTEVTGVPARRLKQLQNVGRLKIMSLPRLLKRLSIPFFRFGNAGDEVQKCLDVKEKTMQDKFNALFENRDLSSYEPLLAPVDSTDVLSQPPRVNALRALGRAAREYQKVENLPMQPIENITDCRQGSHVKEYFVVWKDGSKSTWEPASNLTTEEVAAFLQRDEDGDSKMADSAPMLSPHPGASVVGRDTSRHPDLGSKPDCRIQYKFQEEEITLVTGELTSEKQPREAEHLSRLLNYLAQMLEKEKSKRAFAIGFYLRFTRFIVVVCFIRRGKFCWWQSIPTSTTSRRSHVRFADFFLSVAKCTPRMTGFFPPVYDHDALSGCIGFGGESACFLVRDSTFEPRTVTVGGKSLVVYPPAAKKVLKFWRDRAAFERFQGAQALINDLESRHAEEIECLLPIHHVYENDIIAQLDVGAYCGFAMDFTQWQELADGICTMHHKFGVAHGDISPGNVLLCKDGRLRLTDWGTATLIGQPFASKQFTTFDIFPEAAKETTSSAWMDVVMFLRTVNYVAVGPDCRRKLVKQRLWLDQCRVERMQRYRAAYLGSLVRVIFATAREQARVLDQF